MDFSARRWAEWLSLSVGARPASLTGLRRDRVRMALAAWSEDVRADELEVERPEFVPDMMDWASDALSELIPGVRVAAKSLQRHALVNVNIGLWDCSRVEFISFIHIISCTSCQIPKVTVDFIVAL